MRDIKALESRDFDLLLEIQYSIPDGLFIILKVGFLYYFNTFLCTVILIEDCSAELIRCCCMLRCVDLTI